MFTDQHHIPSEEIPGTRSSMTNIVVHE